MKRKKRLKLKRKFVILFKILLFFLLIFFCLLCFYFYQIRQLKKIGYSFEASKNILNYSKKDFVLEFGESKLLNTAFESEFYDEDNLDSYIKIKYQKQKNIIKNINILIDKGYSNNDISVILAHGNDEDVTEFARKDKIKYLEEFYYNISYAKLKFYDRYLEYSRETGEDEETTVLLVNLGMDKDAYTDPNVIDKFSVDMLVNKYNMVSEDFEPDDLVVIDSNYRNDDIQMGSKVAVDAFIEMYRAAAREGLGLVINSGYRSYEQQQKLCDTYRSLYGENYVNKYVSFPGFSEHQTGLAFDIGSTSSNVFAVSKEYQWMLKNAHKYGFILRFTKRGENITGFRNEPWHYRYVGKEIAKYIYENNITYEEYYVEFLM